jgi:UDP-hydrolysing UDP-N-acetyl-D-glucosamine 2-epimerase
VTFHPATLERESPAEQMAEVLSALDSLPHFHIIFTMPNADAGGRGIMQMIRDYASRHPSRALAFSSLGTLRYLSCLRHCDIVLGNSSSGLIEAPSLGKPSVNIGDRQRGRLRADSVLDCPPRREAISQALRRASSPDFIAAAATVKNPYDAGNASESIVRILEQMDLQSLSSKQFFDLPFSLP